MTQSQGAIVLMADGPKAKGGSGNTAESGFLKNPLSRWPTKASTRSSPTTLGSSGFLKTRRFGLGGFAYWTPVKVNNRRSARYDARPAGDRRGERLSYTNCVTSERPSRLARALKVPQHGRGKKHSPQMGKLFSGRAAIGPLCAFARRRRHPQSIMRKRTCSRGSPLARSLW
jgi:hypothetical protein